MNRLALALSFAISAALPLAQAPGGNAARPNVVLIITDDVGYGDFGAYGRQTSRLPTSTLWPEMASG